VAAHLDEPYRKERFVDVLKRELSRRSSGITT
jgi:hypothetical protein